MINHITKLSSPVTISKNVRHNNRSQKYPEMYYYTCTVVYTPTYT